MTGSLQVKNDKYYIVINTYTNGKRKPTWISTGLETKGNKRKAEKMLRDSLQKYELYSSQTNTEVTFSDYVRYWLNMSEKTVDVITFQGYKLLAESHILPYFDDNAVRLQKVTTQTVQTYIDEKHQNGRKDGNGGLSARTIRLHKNILFQTLKLAVKNNLIASNPCEFVSLPKLERYNSSYYTAEQMQQLLDRIKNEPLYPLIRITALYGLRRSELLGLQWDSIDFDNGLLTIKHTVSKVTKVVAKDKTKNASSYRSFPLTSDAREIFLNEKARETENRKLFGREYAENDYVFKWDDGHAYAPDFVTRKFSKLLAQYDMPHIRFHEIRHSCASMLINAGFNLKDVQEWMGHADIKMTANIYGHLDVARKRNMAEQLTDSLNGGCENCVRKSVKTLQPQKTKSPVTVTDTELFWSE